MAETAQSIELGLLTLCLDHNFWMTHQATMKPEMFPDMGTRIFQSIQKWHQKFSRTTSLGEFTNYFFLENPALSGSAKIMFEMVFERMAEQDMGLDFGAVAVQTVHERLAAARIARVAVQVEEGKATYASLRALLDTVESDIPEGALSETTQDIDAVLKGVDDQTEFVFNLPPLHEVIPGFGPGNFVVVFARPEVGKTGFWVSLTAAPKGFIWQGKKVHAVCNEEPAIRTMARIICAATGTPIKDVARDTAAASSTFRAVGHNIKLFDGVDISLDEIREHVRREHPDILILDQLDKIRIDGDFAREDQHLRELYVRTRELAKAERIGIIALTQASADAQDHSKLNYSMMEGSKTGKAAEADVIIGIGRNPAHPIAYRHLNINKNKITGTHPDFGVMLDPLISTYYP